MTQWHTIFKTHHTLSSLSLSHACIQMLCNQPIKAPRHGQVLRFLGKHSSLMYWQRLGFKNNTLRSPPYIQMIHQIFIECSFSHSKTSKPQTIVLKCTAYVHKMSISWDCKIYHLSIWTFQIFIHKYAVYTAYLHWTVGISQGFRTSQYKAAGYIS